MFDESMLRKYVDDVFLSYDKDNSNTLEPAEIATFFNSIFQRIGNPRRYTVDQASIAMKEIDPMFNGRATKMELLNALKYLISKSQGNMINSNAGLPSNQNNVTQSSYNSHINQYSMRQPIPRIEKSHEYYHSSNEFPSKSINYLSPVKNPEITSISNFSNSRVYSNYVPSHIPTRSIIHSPQKQYISEIRSTLNPVSILNSNTIPMTTSIVRGTQFPSTISPSSTVLESTVHQPGYTKVTTTNGPNGYSKTVTETVTSETKYMY